MGSPIFTGDVVVVGGGHNGLVAGCYLARSGLRVCIVEAKDSLGGLTRTAQIFGEHPDSLASVAAAWSGMLRPSIVSDLGIVLDGRLLDPQVLYRGVNGELYCDYLDSAASLRIHSRTLGARRAHEQARALSSYGERIGNGTSFLELLFAEVDPDRRVQLMTQASSEVRKFLSASMLDVFDEYAAISDIARCGLTQGAFSIQNAPPAATGGGFFLSYMNLAVTAGMRGAWGVLRDGMGAIPAQLSAVFASLGGAVLTNASVTEISPNSTGLDVKLADGRYLHAGQALVCGGGVEQLWSIIGEGSGVQSDETRGRSAVVHLLLDEFPGLDVEVQRMGVSCSEMVPFLFGCGPGVLTDVSTTVDSHLGVSDPCLISGSVFPAGSRWMMYLYVQFVEWNADRATLLDTVVRQVEALLFPNLSSIAREADVLLPSDLSNTLLAPLGHPEHLQMVFPELLYARPASSLSDYRTPLRGVYHGSAVSYPGGLVTGIPGRNAAKVMLQDLAEMSGAGVDTDGQH